MSSSYRGVWISLAVDIVLVIGSFVLTKNNGIIKFPKQLPPQKKKEREISFSVDEAIWA